MSTRPLLRAAAGAALARGALTLLQARPPGGSGRWDRRNHRDRPVTLLAGPALALAGCATSRAPWPVALLAGGGAALVGAYDDLAGDRPAQRGAKGFRGHLAALRRGQLTSGALKVAGIALSALAAVLAAAAAEPRTGAGPGHQRPDDQRPGDQRSGDRRSGDRRPGAVLRDAAVVAASANLVNLLDLRPGRALKAVLAAAVALGEPGPAGAAAGLLPLDLHEHVMIGDAGANAAGALLGVALVRRGHAGKALPVLVALTAASEVVSFTRVIDAVPPLRSLDRWGRLP